MGGYELKRFIVFACGTHIDFNSIYISTEYFVRAIYAFAAGNLIYHVSGAIRQTHRWFIYVATILLSIIIVVFCGYDYIRDDQFVVFAALLICLNISQSCVLVDNRFLSAIGRHCFEIYLVHVTLFAILPKLISPGWRQLIIMTVMTVIISWLIHAYVTERLTPFFVGFLKKNCKVAVIVYICLLLAALGIYASEKYEVFVVSDKQKNELVDTIKQLDAKKHSLIFLLPGEYDQKIVLDDTDVLLIGLSRDKTIIKNSSGRYNNAPILAYGKFRLYNLTVKMTLEDAGDWVPSFEKWPDDYTGYALHIEGPNVNRSESEAIIRNCFFYSESNCAVGLGLHSNQTVQFDNCEFVRVSNGDSFRAFERCQGAFVAHCSNIAGDINQVLILKNNKFYSDYGYAGNILGTLPGSQGMSVLAESNSFWSEEKGTDSFLYEKGDTVLLPESRGNSSACLNAN